MKYVLFEGMVYLVENWVNFMARDKDGSVHGYECRPRLGDSGLGWKNSLGTSWVLLDTPVGGLRVANPNQPTWRDSCAPTMRYTQGSRRRGRAAV